MEVIALLDIIVIWVLAGWLLAKIALPILNLISLILIGETLTHIQQKDKKIASHL